MMLIFQNANGDTVATLHRAHVARDQANEGWQVFGGPLSNAEATEAIRLSHINELFISYGERKCRAWIEDPRGHVLGSAPVTVRGRFAMPDEA